MGRQLDADLRHPAVAVNTRPDPAAARPADLVKRNFVADAEGLLDVCQTLLERREAIAVVLGSLAHRGASEDGTQ
jgi:hypothetical protein